MESTENEARAWRDAESKERTREKIMGGRKKTTLYKIDRLDRLVRQVKIAQEEIEHLNDSIKKDLTNLMESGMFKAVKAGYVLLSAAHNGNLASNKNTFND